MTVPVTETTRMIAVLTNAAAIRPSVNAVRVVVEVEPVRGERRAAWSLVNSVARS